jgi:filamentous hemagglutinin family protein
VIRRPNRAFAAAAGCGLLLLAVTDSSAQVGNLGWVVRDGSIGPAIPDGGDGVVQPGDGASYLITPELGSERGGNLFHSFQYFSIGESEIARFTANLGTQFVIARVPGGEPSNILGGLESPDASLFLLNPFGVFFGEGASVDVNGSFHVSTADQVNFESGEPFLTRESTPPMSLNTATPASFGFLVDDPAGIKFATEELCSPSCVPNDETFSVVGGDILIDGLDENDDTINVPGGQIQLVSVARAGVDVQLDASILDVNDEPAGSFGEVKLQNRAILTVPSDDSASTFGTGKIVIRGGTFVLAGSDLEAVAHKNTVGGQDGADIGIDVAVTDSIELTSYKVEGSPYNVSEVLSTSRKGKSGDIYFSGDSFSMDDATRINNQTRDGGQGADVYIDANTIELSGVSPTSTSPRVTQIEARARDDANTRGGNIYLSGKAPGTADRAQSVSISDSALLWIRSEDGAAGGSISIATQSLTIDEAQVLSGAELDGTSGPIRIDAGDALVTDGGLVQSLAEGQNDGADIEFTGEKLIVTRRGEISTRVIDTAAAGNGGNIDITVDEVEVTESGVIASINFGEGIGGAIDLVADEALTVSNEGQIFTWTGSRPSAAQSEVIEATAAAQPAVPARRGGDLTIHTGRLTVAGREDATAVTQISTITNAAGQADSEDGQGGDLNIHAEQIDLIDGGQLRATTLASGPAGALHVVAHGNDDISGTISIRGVVDRLENFGTPESETRTPTPAGIFATSGEGANSSATGAGGSALIEADIVDIRDGGEIQSSTFGVGPAGSLSLIASESIKVSGESGRSSKIVAQGDVGNGGDLVIATDLLELIDGGEVSVTALATGNSGNVTIGADKIVVRGSNDQTPSGIFAQSVSGLSTGGDAGTIQLAAGDLVVSDNGQLAVRTEGGGNAGNIVVAANSIEITDGGSVSAESRLPGPTAGTAGNIDLRAEQQLEVSSASVTTETADAPGGSIRLSAGGKIRIEQGSEVSARANGDGAAGDIAVADTADFALTSGSTMTAETTGDGQGGQITFENVDDVRVTGGSNITTKSTGTGGGNAGSIVIAANHSVRIDQRSAITTTAEDAGGGRISLQAGQLVYLLDSQLETTVQGEEAGADAGDIDIPLRGDEPGGVAPDVPAFVVINRSTIEANAEATDAGNITIAGGNVLISSDSLIEATSEKGVSGEILISSPDADIVSQVAPLSSSFVDPSDRLLPPCVARTERTGSFMVQNREALPRSLDAPLPSDLTGTPGTDSTPPASGSTDCSVFQESS